MAQRTKSLNREITKKDSQKKIPHVEAMGKPIHTMNQVEYTPREVRGLRIFSKISETVTNFSIRGTPLAINPSTQI